MGALLIVAGLILVADAAAIATKPPTHYGLPPVHQLGTLPVSTGRAAVTAPAFHYGPLPTALRIAPIGVDSPLQPVYLQSDGALGVPPDVRTTGWWAQGVRPGDVGAAVIVGHVDSYDGPGVFLGIRRIKPGAIVAVGRSDGSWVTFAVDGVREFPKDKFPTAEVYGPTRDPQLRLVTCGGIFNRSTRHYDDNVVVFAHLVHNAAIATGTAPHPAPLPTQHPAPQATSVPGPGRRS